MIWEILLFAIGFNVLMFIPAFFLKTDKLTDLSYSLTFIFVILYVFFSKPFSIGSFMILAMVLIWAIRVGLFLFIRIHKQKKDDRFDVMRKSFFKFLGFWLLQGLTVWVVLIPSILYESKFYVIGIFIWLAGLLIEGFADKQKFDFKNNLKNKGKFIQSGIWKYSRHPNYFGEMLCWIGVYIFAGVWLWGIFSPLYIILLLMFVSGIPLLEEKANKKWGKDKIYQKYKKTTSLLIPWFK